MGPPRSSQVSEAAPCLSFPPGITRGCPLPGVSRGFGVLGAGAASRGAEKSNRDEAQGGDPRVSGVSRRGAGGCILHCPMAG